LLLPRKVESLLHVAFGRPSAASLDPPEYVKAFVAEAPAK
jgi:hypothetical protein